MMNKEQWKTWGGLLKQSCDELINAMDGVKHK